MKRYSAIAAMILAGALVLSGCSNPQSSSSASATSSTAAVSESAYTDFKSNGCFRSAKWGMTMSEVTESDADPSSLSPMSEEEVKNLYGDTNRTFLTGNFSYGTVTLDVKYCFEDAALRRISISLNIPENYSEEEIVTLYNSISSEISESNGEGTEVSKKKEDSNIDGLAKYDPEKEYVTTWNSDDSKIELKRVYYSEQTNGEETVPSHQRIFINYTDASLA